MSANPTAHPVDPLLQTDSSVIAEEPLVNRRLVTGHLTLGVAFLVYAFLMGFLYSLQLTGNYPFPNSDLFSPGKIGLVFTNILVYGFLFNMYFGALYYAVPAMIKRHVLSNPIGMAIFWLWNLAVLLTIVGIQAGYAQALPWGETPNGLSALINGKPHIFFADELMTLAILLTIVQFFIPIAAAKGLQNPIPVGTWFITGGLVWFLLSHLVGSYGFELFNGAASAVFGGLYIQGVIGMTLAGLGWGLLYFFVPAITHKPVWSYAVSMLGFWGFAFFFPMTGVSNYLNSSIPSFAQNSAVVFTVAVQVVTFTLLLNFFMTLSGTVRPFDKMSIRYIYTGLALYAISSAIALLQVQFRMHELVQYTQWMTGQSILVLYGVFGFWLLGIFADLWPRLFGKSGWFSEEISNWTYWLNLAGVLMFFIASLAGGAAEGGILKGGGTWFSVQDTMGTFWTLQALSIVLIIWANSLLLFNMVMTQLPESTVREIVEAME